MTNEDKEGLGGGGGVKGQGGPRRIYEGQGGEGQGGRGQGGLRRVKEGIVKEDQGGGD